MGMIYEYEPGDGVYEQLKGQTLQQAAESYCQGCGAGVDQAHLPTCSVWLEILAQD